MHYSIRRDAYLQHARKNQSPYGGGFNKGKNTSEYNRNYYQANKDKWTKNKSRRETDYFYKMKTDAQKVINDFSNVLVKEINFFRKFFKPVDAFIRFFFDNPLTKEINRAAKEDLNKKEIKRSLDKAGQSFRIGWGTFQQVMKTDAARAKQNKK